MEFHPDFFPAVYLVATLLFIFGLKGLSSPKTALRGNRLSMLGMVVAIATTLMHPDVVHYEWILAGLAMGALVGIPVALKISMTSMPQLVAALHSFVGLSAVLVALGTYYVYPVSDSAVTMIELMVGAFIGAITFTGSIVAFGKLQGILPSNPVNFRGQHLFNLLFTLIMLGFGAHFVMEDAVSSFMIMTAMAFVLGVLIVIPIGGADMPVVVSMLNSYSGWAAAATGFTLSNNLLITTGALVGASGAILSYIMCKAMNRSIFSVILGGFGTDEQAETSASAQATQKGVKSVSASDIAFMLENASRVIIIPGYGMAVAQAQHSLKELQEVLCAKGVEMKFAIHPVAGRMPGHMNVLLAEAEIDYETVTEMDEINGEFTTTDVAFVIGANDVVNPDAKTNQASPLYGMPILDAYKAKQVFVSKRSLKPGYAGVDNALFYNDNCSLIFGDAKEMCEKIVQALRES